MDPENEVLTPAEIAFYAYALAGPRPGLTFDGKPMPSWRAVGPKVATAWVAFESAVLNMRDTPATDNDAAAAGYRAYGEYVQWTTHSGRKMPDWNGIDEETRSRYVAAASAVRRFEAARAPDPNAGDLLPGA